MAAISEYLQALQADAPNLIKPAAPQSDAAQSFAIHQSNFANLANADSLEALKSQAIAIDIQDALEALGTDSYLEVTLPTVGLTDFLPNQLLSEGAPQAFPVILSVDGKGQGENSLSAKPDFVLVKDIIGNLYEVMVTPSGEIEVPEEGWGRFSQLSSMTFIYSKSQLDNPDVMQEIDGELAGQLLLLPPPGFTGDLTVTTRVTHLNEQYERLTDWVKKQPITLIDSVDIDAKQLALKQQHDLDNPYSLQFEVKSSPQIKFWQPSVLSLKLPDNASQKITLESFEQQAHNSGWKLEGDVLSKAVGLSTEGRKAIINEVYSEYDITVSLLAGDAVGTQSTNGFNQFFLIPEAITEYYESLVDGVLHHQINPDVFFERVPQERFAEVDFTGLDVSEHDAEVLSQFQEVASVDGQQALSQFLGESTTDFPVTLTLGLDEQVQGPIAANLDVSSAFDNTSSQINFDLGQLNVEGSQHGMQHITLESGFNLTPAHEATAVYVTDVLADGDNVIKHFDIAQDTLNLGELLSRLPDVDPSSVATESHGNDLMVTAMNQQGQAVHLVTLQSPMNHDELGGFTDFINTDF